MAASPFVSADIAINLPSGKLSLDELRLDSLTLRRMGVGGHADPACAGCSRFGDGQFECSGNKAGTV